jgi:cyclohexanone monooxygenase
MAASTDTAADTAADTATPPAPVDTEALRRRYEEERLKRVRSDGNAQYVAITGRYAHYLDDPYVEPGFTRDPINREMDVLVVGGGFGGLLAGCPAARRRATTICASIEKAGDFGGTWYWNRYPGAACDTESYIYLPLLEETGYMPTSQVRQGARNPRALRRIGRALRPVPAALLPDR